KDWRCDECVEEEEEEPSEDEVARQADFVKRQKRLVEEQRKQHRAKRALLMRKRELLKPFVSENRLCALEREYERDRKGGKTAEEGDEPPEDQRPAACDTTQPSYVTATLRDYQVEGVNWMVTGYDSGIGGILVRLARLDSPSRVPFHSLIRLPSTPFALQADQMGLGKTLQTLTFLSYLKKMRGAVGPSLVVAPLAVYQNWANECKSFTPELTFFKLHGSAQARTIHTGRCERNAVATLHELGGSFAHASRLEQERSQLFSRMDVVYAEYDVFITTYDTLKNSEPFFTETIPRWQCLVVDEGHNLKNESSGLTTSLSRIKANYRLLLTGTPLQNNLHELWVLLTSLLPDYFTSSESFDASFDLNKQAFDSSLVQYARSLLQFFMLRRKKSDVAKWYARVLRRDEHSASILSTSQLLTTITQLRKVCNHPKILLSQHASTQGKCAPPIPSRGTSLREDKLAQAVKDELQGLSSETLVAASGKMLVLDRLLCRLKEEGSRVLLFSTFTQTLDVIQDFLSLRGHSYLRMDGSTNKIRRELDLRDFNAPGSEYFIYLISTRAGGVGINLATADTVVLYDSDWNPQIDLQAIDRAHRIGQTKPVRIFRLITSRSVEVRILQRAKQKIRLDTAVIEREERVEEEGDACEEGAIATTTSQREKEMRRDELMEILGVGEWRGEGGGAWVKVKHRRGSTSEGALSKMMEAAFSAPSSSAGVAGVREVEEAGEGEGEEEELSDSEGDSGEEGSKASEAGAIRMEVDSLQENGVGREQSLATQLAEGVAKEETGCAQPEEKASALQRKEEVRAVFDGPQGREEDGQQDESKKRQQHFQVHSELARASRRREQASRFEPRFNDGPERKKKSVLYI
ncbi:MAG: hypothetical protein SGPRY_006042, partial [Prymnesium sp.]